MSDAQRPFPLLRELTSSQNSLYAFIFSLIPQFEVAQELLQETNATICEKADEFTPGTHFLTWACTIARYKVLSYRRGVARERLVFDDRVFEQLAGAVEQEGLDLTEKFQALSHCLQQLSPEQQDLVNSRYHDNASMETLAQATGYTRTRVSVTLHRIRQTLLKCVERRLREGSAE